VAVELIQEIGCPSLAPTTVLEYADINLLSYWNIRYEAALMPPDNRNQDLSLCRMALDIQALPFMSSECERIFSSVKSIVTDRRNCLRLDIIEACECLRYWYAANERSKNNDTTEDAFDSELIDIDELYVSELHSDSGTDKD
jgi:hypothetical protein